MVQVVADVTQLRAQVGAPGRLIDVAQRSGVLPRGRLGGVLPACPLGLCLRRGKISHKPSFAVNYVTCEILVSRSDPGVGI